jgi:hypothetical protein
MTIRKILKWSLLIILVASGGWLFIEYWMSTNHCARSIPPGGERMKAIRYCEYGTPDVLKVDEVEKPVPNDNELRVRVRAASLNFIDTGVVRGPWVLRLMIAFIFLIFPHFNNIVNDYIFDSPMAIFEMVVSFWLLFKGLRSSAVAEPIEALRAE